MLGVVIGGLLLFPIANTYGRLVQQIQDAGAEIAYTETVMPPLVSFAAGWTMVLSYAIVCPWEAVATGNLLARVFPELNSYRLYSIAGTPIYAPRLGDGLALTLLVASGLFQDVMTFGLLATFAVFTLLGFARGSVANMAPLFPREGGAGVVLSIFLVLQIVPYFMTGFESVAKGSEEAREGFDPRQFTTAIYAALFVGFLFYVIVIAVVTYVYPWHEIVSGHVRTEVAFERAFGSHAIAQLILFGAFLSLLKIFNGNFVAGTRMLYALGRRNVVHRSLGFVHPQFGTPAVAITLLAILTALCARRLHSASAWYAGGRIDGCRMDGSRGQRPDRADEDHAGRSRLLHRRRVAGICCLDRCGRRVLGHPPQKRRVARPSGCRGRSTVTPAR